MSWNESLSITKEIADIKESIPNIISGFSFTDYFFVSPNGNGNGGKTWTTAYTTLQAALAASSSDPDDCTLIILGPHATDYDINTTGDPTYSGNYAIIGSSREWCKITNSHASATSILKFTGKIYLKNITIDCESTNNNGVIVHGTSAHGCMLENLFFDFLHSSGSNIALQVSGGVQYAHLRDIVVHGHVARTTGLLLDTFILSELDNIELHDCVTGLKITNGLSDNSIFNTILLHTCALGIDINAGNTQMFNDVTFWNCTTNIDDSVGDANWNNVKGEFPVTIEPDDLTGVAITAGVGADTWGNDTEIRAAATSTSPFKLFSLHVEADTGEKYRIRLSADSGTSFFFDSVVEGVANETVRLPLNRNPNCDYLFNQGIRISGSIKSETGGNDLNVWLGLEEI